jgi:3-phosphoshikimate 1-carboxyvinyltransferase
MGRVAAPLVAMGASVAGRAGTTLAPFAVTGSIALRGIEHATSIPSAQVKSCVLLAGLAATGSTSVRESTFTRDHTERMLRARGVAVRTEHLDDGGAVHTVVGPTTVRALDERVPGDISGAAFWMVAAAIHPDADLLLRNVGTNPTRRGIIDLLRRMGAEIEERPVGTGGSMVSGEPSADLAVRSSTLHGIDVDPGEVAGAIDEIPILCLATAVASGRSRIRGVGELRHKESDRVAGIVAGLAALGARVRADGDDIEIEGGRELRGAPVASLDDHRLAMTFAVAGLVAEGTTLVGQPASADISYPGFFDELERVRA